MACARGLAAGGRCGKSDKIDGQRPRRALLAGFEVSARSFVGGVGVISLDCGSGDWRSSFVAALHSPCGHDARSVAYIHEGPGEDYAGRMAARVYGLIRANLPKNREWLVDSSSCPGIMQVRIAC